MDSTSIQYVDRVVIKTGPNVVNEAQFYEQHPEVSPKVHVVNPGVEWRDEDGQLVMSHERMVHPTEIFSVQDMRQLVNTYQNGEPDYTIYEVFTDHLVLRETWFMEDHGPNVSDLEAKTVKRIVDFLMWLEAPSSPVSNALAHGDLQTKNLFYRPIPERLPGAIDPLPVVAPAGYDLVFYYATLFSEGSVMARQKKLEDKGIWSELSEVERVMTLALMVLDDNPARISRTQGEWDASLAYVTDALRDYESIPKYVYPVDSDVHYIQSVTSTTE